MDTRFWGPSGWQFYHLIAQTYPKKPDPITQRKYELFFVAMKDILPCRFCRESATKFMDELPLHPALKNKDTLTKWLYDFHNKVNDKLRGQCKDDPRVICPPPDPSFTAVTTVYEELLSVDPQVPPGLDFLWCVAYNYENNPTSDKVQAYFQTFMNLVDIYPYAHLRSIIRHHVEKHILYEALKTRESFLKWWYSLSTKLCKETGFEQGSYRATLRRYGTIKSACKRGKTCRNGRKVRDHRKTYKVTHLRLVHI